MNHYYVPSYLTNVERQFDGYPKSLTDEQKRELEDAVRGLLLKHPVLSMNDIQRMIGSKVSCLKNAVVWDFIHACIDRALREVAEPVFRLTEHERYKFHRENKQKKLALLPLQVLDIKNNQYDRKKGEKVFYFIKKNFLHFSSLFPSDVYQGNYEIEEKLRQDRVLYKSNKVEPKPCSLLIRFSNMRAAEAFVRRFNRWAFRQSPELQDEFFRLFKGE